MKSSEAGLLRCQFRISDDDSPTALLGEVGVTPLDHHGQFPASDQRHQRHKQPRQPSREAANCHRPILLAVAEHPILQSGDENAVAALQRPA